MLDILHLQRSILGLTGACLLAGILATPSARAAERVTPEDVRNALERGKQALRRNLRTYNYAGARIEYRILTAMALLNAGVSPKDADVRTILNNLAERATSLTDQQYLGSYQGGLLLMLFQMTGDPAYQRVAADLSRRLLRYQFPNGGWGDNSRTQFALLGLKAARDMGLDVPDEVFERARRFVEGGQNADGGWSYYPGDARSWGSMTVAGCSGLFICGDTLFNGRNACDMHGLADRRLSRGLEWLANNFSVRTNPGHNGYLFYYLYGLERVGMLLAQRTMGGHDWYREGAAFLIRTQSPDGSWSGEMGSTEFAMLFLGKGSKPIALQKLRYDKGHHWNLDPYDAKNLTEAAARDLETPMTYQIVGTQSDTKELALGPVLYLQGSQSFEFEPDFRTQLRGFLDQGGFLVAVAGCGRKPFEDSFKQEVLKMYPEAAFERLAPDHPVYGSRHTLTRGELYMLEGVDLGCRTAIFYAPKDVSCVWGGQCQCENENVILHDEALKLGVNIVAYALGFQRLRDKLDDVKVEVSARAEDRLPRGALVVGQLYHAGGWNPGPMAIPNLTKTLREQTKMPAEVAVRRVLSGSDELGDYPALYMTGYRSFKFGPDQIKALRAYLDRGGFLFADPWCGRDEFDESFRALCKELYPNQPLERLPLSHGIFEAPFKIEHVTYKERVAAKFPKLGSEPYLEGVTVNQRLLIVYSRFNLGCELQGNPMPLSLGVKGESAYRLAVNTLVYALSH